MSTPCQGCKALVVQTADDYNVYSLQRALYSVNPLMIIPQPNSWVDHVCADGFVVHKLYTQGEDWVTFWQQVLAECANHTVPTGPIVISDPDTDSGDDPPPEVDPNTGTNDDPVPGPDTVVPPPIVPPPVEPPGGGGTGGGTGGGGSGWGNPNGPPTPPGSPPTPPPLPPNNPGKQWAEVTGMSYAAVGCNGDPDLGPDPIDLGPVTDFAFAMLIAQMRKSYAAIPGAKYFYYWKTPTWFWTYRNDTAFEHSIVIDQSNYVADGSPVANITDYYGSNHVVTGSFYMAVIEFKYIWEVDL